MSINVQSWLTQYMSEIDCLQNEKSRFILRCSIIDAFAQSAFPNTNHTSSSFSSFIETYSTTSYSNILKSICPVTLYYNYRDEYDFMSLHLTHDSKIYLATDAELSNESNRILNLISDEKKRRTAAYRHTYSRLIYQRRNKIIHDFYDVESHMNFVENQTEQLPHVTLRHSFTDNEFIPEHWVLNIPEQFIVNVFHSAIEGYLMYCQQNQRSPFKSEVERSYLLSWYDK